MALQIVGITGSLYEEVYTYPEMQFDMGAILCFPGVILEIFFANLRFPHKYDTAVATHHEIP